MVVFIGKKVSIFVKSLGLTQSIVELTPLSTSR